jgi:hypothetical protein
MAPVDSHLHAWLLLDVDLAKAELDVGVRGFLIVGFHGCRLRMGQFGSEHFRGPPAEPVAFNGRIGTFG